MKRFLWGSGSILLGAEAIVLASSAALGRFCPLGFFSGLPGSVLACRILLLVGLLLAVGWLNYLEWLYVQRWSVNS